MRILSDEIGRLDKSVQLSGISISDLDPLRLGKSRLLSSMLLVLQTRDNFYCVAADKGMRGQLLLWAALVCAHHNVVVANFAASFADGRALCAVIKHYQPSLITNIQENTTLTQLSQDSDNDLDSTGIPQAYSFTRKSRRLELSSSSSRPKTIYAIEGETEFLCESRVFRLSCRLLVHK